MAITLIVKEAEAPEPIPEGVYKAVLKDIEEGSGEYGDYVKFTFEIAEGEFKGITRNSVASKKLSKSNSGKTSKLYDYVKALTKTAPSAGEEIDLDGLKGKECQIIVKDGTEKDGIQYQVITAVMQS